MTMEDYQKNKRITRYFVVAALVVVIGISIFLLFRRSPQPASTKSTVSMTSTIADTEMVTLSSDMIRRAGIGTVTVESKNFTSEMQAVGVIQIPEPAEKTIAARAGGRI